MNCPACQHDKTEAVDSRPSGDTVRRRRCCQKCDHRFTTYEISSEKLEELQNVTTEEALRARLLPMIALLSEALSEPETSTARFKLKT